MAERAGARFAVGLLATDEAVAALRRFGPGVQPGLADQLPRPDTCACLIGCDSGLLVVPGETVPASWREIQMA